MTGLNGKIFTQEMTMTFVQIEKRTGRIFLLLIAFAFVFAACGDADDNDSDNANSEDSEIYEGEHGLMVEPNFEPDPPQSGEVELTLKLTVDGEALEGAEVDLEPWMPAHDHGSNTEPVVVEEGDGIYRVDDLTFSMPGLWDITVDIQWDDLQTEVIWEVEVGG
jgi:hypothetical protein